MSTCFFVYWDIIFIIMQFLTCQSCHTYLYTVLSECACNDTYMYSICTTYTTLIRNNLGGAGVKEVCGYYSMQTQNWQVFPAREKPANFGSVYCIHADNRNKPQVRKILSPFYKGLIIKKKSYGGMVCKFLQQSFFTSYILSFNKLTLSVSAPWKMHKKYTRCVF